MEQNGLEAGILTPEEYESRIAEYVKHIPKALELGVFLARDGTIFPVFIVPEEIINWLSERAKWKHKTELVGLHAFIEVVLDQERRICLPFCLVNKKARTFAGLAVMTTFDPETRRYGGRPGKLVLASEEWGDAGKAILVEVAIPDVLVRELHRVKQRVRRELVFVIEHSCCITRHGVGIEDGDLQGPGRRVSRAFV